MKRLRDRSVVPGRKPPQPARARRTTPAAVEARALPNEPTKFVTLYKRKGSPFWWARFVVPPAVRRLLDTTDQPLLAELRPDKRNRCCLSLKTTSRRHAERLRAKWESLLRDAWEGKLTNSVIRAITSTEQGRRDLTTAEFFADVAADDQRRVAVAAQAQTPIESKKRDGLQPETAARHDEHRQAFELWLAEDAPGRTLYVSDVTAAHLARFKDWMLARYTVGTYNHAKGYLSGLWENAVSKGYADRNPWSARELRARRDPKRAWPVLTEEDRQHVLDAEKTWAVNGLIVMMCTGARSSDLVWLQRSHADFRSGDLTLFQSKTCKYVTLDKLLHKMPPLAEAVRRQLAAHESLFVFPNAAGQMNRRQYLNKQFNAALKRIVGNHVSAHTFRRSAATMMDRAGVPLDVIRDYLGHATVEQTLLYIQRRAAGVAQAAQALNAR